MYAEAGNLDDLRQKAGDNVCALMLEPIQGGGVVPLDREFVQAAAELCRQRDLLLLFDEVQTGVGRTGTLYAYEQFGVRPDVRDLGQRAGRRSAFRRLLVRRKNVCCVGRRGRTDRPSAATPSLQRQRAMSWPRSTIRPFWRRSPVRVNGCATS